MSRKEASELEDTVKCGNRKAVKHLLPASLIELLQDHVEDEALVLASGLK